MTKVEFFTQDDRITGFCCSGHSGYGEAGTDIVCAAVSAAVNLTECTVNDVCGARAKVRVDEGKASVTLTLPAACDEEESVQAALSGLMVYLIGLREEYPDYLDVLAV